MKSGQTLWNELVDHYYKGVEEVRTMQSIWTSLKDVIDDERFTSKMCIRDRYVVFYFIFIILSYQL